MIDLDDPHHRRRSPPSSVRPWIAAAGPAEPGGRLPACVSGRWCSCAGQDRRCSQNRVITDWPVRRSSAHSVSASTSSRQRQRDLGARSRSDGAQHELVGRVCAAAAGPEPVDGQRDRRARNGWHRWRRRGRRRRSAGPAARRRAGRAARWWPTRESIPGQRRSHPAVSATPSSSAGTAAEHRLERLELDPRACRTSARPRPARR